MSDRNLLNREQIQNIGMASAHMHNALEDSCTPEKKPYLNESRPITGAFSDYATTSCAPRFNCHTDKTDFQDRYNRMMKNFVENMPIVKKSEVFKYRNGRIEEVDLDAFYRESLLLLGKRNIPIY